MTRNGFILLEALVALAILAIAIGGPLAAASEAAYSVENQYLREQAVRSASRLMTVVSLWPRTDLDRHLGWSQQGDLLLHVSRSTSGHLYAIQIVDAGDRTLLRTSLCRSER